MQLTEFQSDDKYLMGIDNVIVWRFTHSPVCGGVEWVSRASNQNCGY